MQRNMTRFLRSCSPHHHNLVFHHALHCVSEHVRYLKETVLLSRRSFPASSIKGIGFSFPRHCNPWFCSMNYHVWLCGLVIHNIMKLILPSMPCLMLQCACLFNLWNWQEHTVTHRRPFMHQGTATLQTQKCVLANLQMHFYCRSMSFSSLL